MSATTSSGAYPRLTSPLPVGPLTLRNRAVVTAHVTNFGSADHLATDRTRDYLAERARGGAGLIVSESLAVHPTAGPNTFFLQLWDDGAVEPLRQVTEAVRAEGAEVVAQLNHGGREHNPLITRRPLVAPSPIPSPKGGEVPHELTVPEIQELVQAFAAAARRAVDAGFSGVEVHAGHGYLVQQFLSPWSNHRTDAYGGDDAGRRRFLTEILLAVRSVVPSSAAVGLRISADEFVPEGLDVDQMREIAAYVESLGVLDYLSVSQGSYARPSTFVPDHSFGPTPFVGLTRAIREVVTLPLVAVGAIVTPEEAEQILAEGTADLIGMTRAHISDPHLMAKVVTGRRDEVRECILCNEGCFGRLMRGTSISCVQNPAVGFEGVWPEEPVPVVDGPRRVVVVGGGPAGMECAWVAAARGHHVTLLERAEQVGGALRRDVEDGDRAHWAPVLTWRRLRLRQTGVDVRTGVHADPTSVADLAPDDVVLAVGDAGEARDLARALADAIPTARIRAVGDAAAPRDTFAALTDGHRAGREL